MKRWLFLTMLASAIVLSLAGRQALGGAPALRIEEDLTGDIIACDGVDYTITAGSAVFLFREGVTPSGNFSGIAMFVAKHVVATDGKDTFSILGAGTGSAAVNGKTGGVASTFTTMLQIVEQGGGVVAGVRLLAHMSPNENTVEFDFGECAALV